MLPLSRRARWRRTACVACAAVACGLSAIARRAIVTIDDLPFVPPVLPEPAAHAMFIPTVGESSADALFFDTRASDSSCDASIEPPSCAVVRREIERCGVARVSGRLPIAYLHAFGQIAAGAFLERHPSEHVPHMIAKMHELSKRRFASVPTTQTLGIFHGALWYALGTFAGTTDAAWLLVQQSYCPESASVAGYYWNCLHAVGHAAMIRVLAGRAYDACDALDGALVSFAQLDEMLRFCRATGSRGVAFACASGLFHGYFEHARRGAADTWHDPCSRVPEQHACFHMLFYAGLTVQTWRQAAIARLPDERAACATFGVGREACAFGLSTVGFPLYDFSSTYPCDAYPNEPLLILVLNDVHEYCRTFHARPNRSSHTLLQWCGGFPDAHRRACVAGSVYWSFNVYVIKYDVPHARVRRFCAQLGRSTWADAEALQRVCVAAALWDRQPATWQSLSFPWLADDGGDADGTEGERNAGDEGLGPA